MKTHLNSFARNSLSTAIPGGGQGEGERVEGVVGEGEDGEDDDVDVVDDGEAGDREEGDGEEEEEWIELIVVVGLGCFRFGLASEEAKSGFVGESRFGKVWGEAKAKGGEGKPPLLPPLSVTLSPSTAISILQVVSHL